MIARQSMRQDATGARPRGVVGAVAIATTCARGAVRIAAYCLLVCGSFLALAGEASATHFRYAHISWAGAGGNSVQFKLQAVLRRTDYSCLDPATLALVPCSEPDGFPGVGDVITEEHGIALDTGDGNQIDGPLGELLFVVTSFDPGDDWLFSLAIDPADLPAVSTALDYTYANAGNFTAAIDGCCRIGSELGSNAHINNPDGEYRVETVVNVGSGNNAPASSLPPIVGCILGEICTFSVPVSDPDGDPVGFRLSTPAEAGSPAFSHPGPNAPTIDPDTGLFSWYTAGATVTPGLNTLYSTQVTLEEINGPAKSAVDFFIQLDTCSAGSAPEFSAACDGELTVNAGDTINFSVEASDPDLADTITLNVVGSPLGSSMVPLLPVTGNPVSTNFSWTPSIADVGTSVVTFIATDDCGSQAGRSTLCSITVVASEDCTNGVDDDGDGQIDCDDEDCRVACTEDCDNGVDDDVDGDIDCLDSDCDLDPACAEDCTNGLDDDGDGAVDCDDPGCQACDDGDECTNDYCSPGTGCVNDPMISGAACRWAIVAGSATDEVAVSTRFGSTITGDLCMDAGDMGEGGGIGGSLVSMQDQGSKSIKFRRKTDVAEDIVTAGGGLTSAGKGAVIPGTSELAIGTGSLVAKSPSGTVDTTGTDPRVALCGTAQDDVAAFAQYVAALPQTRVLSELTPSTRGTLSIPVDNIGGVNVYDLDSFKVKKLRLEFDGGGDAGSVVVLRASKNAIVGRDTEIVAVNGLAADRVLIYAATGVCKLSRDISGLGTLLCPDGNFVARFGIDWTGAILGGKKQIKIGRSLRLVRKGFIGF